MIRPNLLPRPRVLVVEDDDDTRDAVALALARAGFDVGLAANGRDALVYARGWRPDALLVDLMMPVMDGFELLELLAATEPWPPPVVFMSAAHDRLGALMAARAAAVIPKPFEARALAATMYLACRRARLR